MPSPNESVLLDPRTGLGDGLDTLASSRLSSLLSDAPAIAQSLLAGDVNDNMEALQVIRSVTAIRSKALRDHDRDLFSAGVRSVAAIWAIGDPKAMYPVRTPDFEASLWERLVTAIYALGGLAVRQERWEEMRQLITEPATSPGHSYSSWLRQGQVASSRSAVYPDSVLTLAARRLGELDTSAGGADPLTAVCEFDLLAGIVIGETPPTKYFPNCAEFSESLVEPLVIEKLRRADSPLRQHVFAGNDAGLREALRVFDATARTQAALTRRAGGNWEWRAFADARTWIFIDQGHILEDWEPGTGTGWS